jgi:hypothetical protein
VDASLPEELGEVLTISRSLVYGLFKHYDSANVFLDAWGGEKKISVGSSVFKSVLNIDRLEALTDCAGRLVSG